MYNPKPPKNYYCLVKKSKGDDYTLIIRQGKRAEEVMEELRHNENWYVLGCFSAKFIKSVQAADNVQQAMKERPGHLIFRGNQSAYYFIKQIKLMEDEYNVENESK